MKRALGALALVLVVVVGTAGPAAAHAQLVSTDPVAGAVMDRAPAAVTVVFDGVIHARADALQVHDGAGDRVGDGELQRIQDGRGLRLTLPRLDDGGYVVTWRVVSADGHPVSGGVTWRVGRGEAVDQSVFQRLLNAEGGDTDLHVLAAATRTALFAALVVLVGGLAFVLFVWPTGVAERRVRRTLVGAAAVGAVATVLSLGVEGADIAGLGVTSAFSWSRGLDAWHTPFGKAAVARLALLVVLAWWASTSHRPGRRPLPRTVAFGVVATAMLATVSWGGHARTGRWTALALPLDVVHLWSGAIWFGGLAVLCVFVLPRVVDDDGTVERFSRLAAVCVGVVAFTGVVQGYRQLRDVGAIRGTDYGRVLVVKVALVALVVVLGALSRSLVRARQRDDVDVDELRHRVRRSVGFETLVGVGVLVATSLLVAANPTGVAAGEGFSKVKVVDGTQIEMSLVPARSGPVTIHLYASDPTAGLTTSFDATATMSLASKGISGVKVPLHRAGRSHWSAYGVDVPIRGDWRFEVNVTIGDLTSRTTEFEVAVR